LSGPQCGLDLTAKHILRGVGLGGGATKWLKRAILLGRGVLQLPQGENIKIEDLEKKWTTCIKISGGFFSACLAGLIFFSRGLTKDRGL
jgi:hypothetical protein